MGWPLLIPFAFLLGMPKSKIEHCVVMIKFPNVVSSSGSNKEHYAVVILCLIVILLCLPEIRISNFLANILII